jgi:hypothetical protein
VKILIVLATAVAFAANAIGHAPSAQPEPIVQRTSSFDLVVRLPLAQAAALFGPQGERAWAGNDWNPEFIYPQPARDELGAVFSISHGQHRAIWVTTAFDIDARHFQYVYFIPDTLVTTIDVRFNAIGPELSGVHVSYTRTALTSEGNEHVAALAAGDSTAGREWQQAIDDYLRQRH